MRQLVFHGPRQLSIEESEPRALAPDEVRVSVHSVGVCDSDVHGYAGANTHRVPGLVMGHEAVGTIAETGAAVSGFERGDAVAINPIVSCGECDQCRAGAENLCKRRRIYGCVLDLPGAYTESVTVKADNAVFFHGPAPLEWGALVEPLSVGTHATGVGQLSAGAETLVVGGGPIGLGTALAARRRGAARIVVAEPIAHRREVAGALGFETLDPGDGALPESTFEVAFECVRHPETLETTLRAVRPRGLVVFVGLAEETIAVPAAPLMVGERRIAGSSAYGAGDFRDTAAWVGGGEEDLAPMIELRVGLDGLPDVFAGYADGSLAAMKTLLQLEA